jgi:hypothetical protein
MLCGLQVFTVVRPVRLDDPDESRFSSFPYLKLPKKQGSALASVALLRVLRLVILKQS